MIEAAGARAIPVPNLAEKVWAMEIQAEKDRGRQDTHEEVCAERYQGIRSDLTGMKESMSAMAKAVGDLAKAQSDIATAQAVSVGFNKGVAEARKPPWWVPVLSAVAGAAAALVAVISALGLPGGHAPADTLQQKPPAVR